MPDITSRSDIKTIIDAFYDQLLKDDLVGHFFHEVVELNLAEHLPVLYDFWETMLLDNMVYQGNPMIKHLALHRKSPLLPEHFERWLTLWEANVRERFQGPAADQAVSRARDIARLMQWKTQTA